MMRVSFPISPGDELPKATLNFKRLSSWSASFARQPSRISVMGGSILPFLQAPNLGIILDSSLTLYIKSTSNSSWPYFQSTAFIDDFLPPSLSIWSWVPLFKWIIRVSLQLPGSHHCPLQTTLNMAARESEKPSQFTSLLCSTPCPGSPYLA